MGYGGYSESSYEKESATRGYASKSSHQLFSSVLKEEVSSDSLNREARRYNSDVRQEMLNVGVRECRDSIEHPKTTPIIVALDVTGSMRDTPHRMIKEQLPILMGYIEQLGIPDPQILFMAIGDHECDRYPIQIAQFEAETSKLLDGIQQFVLEGGGGPNYGESYLLAWLVAGYHTETDAWYKRKEKGYLFTIGDEPTLTSVDSKWLEEGFGYKNGAKTMTAKELIDKASEQYNVYHIHMSDASKGLKQSDWASLVGQNLLTCNSGDVAKKIASTIKESLTERPIGINDETPFY